MYVLNNITMPFTGQKWHVFYLKVMLFCRFPVIVCSVYAVLCNMKYVGTHVFQLPFLSKTACLLCFYACRCQAHVHACMVVFLRFAHACSCMQ